MKHIKYFNAFFTMILLSLPVAAHADWSGAEMHPGMAPNMNVMPQVRVEPQHRVETPWAPERHTAPVVRHDQHVDHRQVTERHQDISPGYFRRDVQYYQVQIPFPVADVDTSFVVPDGFELVPYNGETFYYNQGTFYQEVDGQITVIPAVLGVVVDNIPEDYQIIMADGVHYLFSDGVYYQRVDQGFEVVQPPVSNQE